ncbi:UNVERIFIED_ORG: MFS family permease, partial [Microbispora rosea subsp. rosea]
MAMALPGIHVTTATLTIASAATDNGPAGAPLADALLIAALVPAVTAFNVCRWLADRVGRRRMLVATSLILAAAAMTAFTASADAVLFAAVALQGAAAAAAVPCAAGLYLEHCTTRGRAAAVGVSTTGFAAGAAFTCLAGAGLASQAGWRGVYLVSVAAAGLLLIGLAWVPDTPGWRRARRPDPAREALVVVAAATLPTAVFLSAGIWSLLTAAAGTVALAGAGWRLVAKDTGKPSFTGVAVTLCEGAAAYLVLLAIPLLVQPAGQGSWAMAATAAGPLAAVAGAALGRMTVRAASPRLTVYVGAATAAGGAAWLLAAGAGALSNAPLWAPALILAGLGLGATHTGAWQAGLAGVSSRRHVAGLTELAAARHLGGTLAATTIYAAASRAGGASVPAGQAALAVGVGVLVLAGLTALIVRARQRVTPAPVQARPVPPLAPRGLPRGVIADLQTATADLVEAIKADLDGPAAQCACHSGTTGTAVAPAPQAPGRREVLAA